MLVLALDTTTRAGSCALARDGVVLHEIPGDANRPHDVRLPGDLVGLLGEARVTLDDIDVYAVATGPGSFTGLRIGIATMQGLAFAAGKPLIGVSGFDALCRIVSPGPLRGTRPTADDDVGRVPQTGPAMRVATWVDAWRGEVYAALYEHGREVEPPTVEPPDVVLARLPGAPTRFIGDAAAIYADAIVSALGPAAHIADPAAPPLAGAIALIATASAQAGHRPPPHAIRPLYVRRPDAERARHARALR
jgi:tRNA threonylcarbamoyladenosine biosynthesis protein TsaB